MDLLEAVPYLSLFWSCQLGLGILGFLKVFLDGSSMEKLKTDTPSEEQNLGWFRFRKRVSQYYLTGAVFTGLLLWTQVGAYCWGQQPNTRIQSFIDLVTAPRVHNSDATSTILATSLLFVHLLRHVFECARIRIFSRRPTLNLIEVALSYIHYIVVATSLVAEGPDLTQAESCFDLSNLRMNHLGGVLVFLSGSVLQRRCSQALAKLRRNKAGHIVTSNYRMPKGGWFDLVSSPHYFAETLIFAGIGLVLGMRNRTVWLMFASMVGTHLFLSVNTQNFYLKKFGSDYPKERRRLIPYLF